VYVCVYVYIYIYMCVCGKKSEVFPAFIDYVNVKKEKNCVPRESLQTPRTYLVVREGSSEET